MAVQRRRVLLYHSPCAGEKTYIKGRAGSDAGGKETRAGRCVGVSKSGAGNVAVLARRAAGVAGGGAGGGAWPRCGTTRNPSWRPRGSVSVPEQRWSRSRFPGLAAEERLRCPRLLPAGGGSVPRWSSADVTAGRWRPWQRPGPGEGVSWERPSGSGQPRRPGLLPPPPASRLRVARAHRPLQPCLAVRHWGWSLFPQTWDTPFPEA